MKISKHMALTIGVVKLMNDFYVLFNPAFINLDEDEVYKASCYYDKMCLDLWGDGTAVKVFVFKADDDFDGLIDIFSYLIETYEDSCLINNEESEIDYHEFVEEKMILMGMPLCYGNYNEKGEPKGDAGFVFTSSDFKDRFLVKLAEEFKQCKDYKSTDDMVLDISKICCSKQH